ncbi:Rab3 GTPase-activating protein catalytic subunit-domain-containing protein [Spinellus fusiger]|nr:Rab3 GTPase-activating protein catalytic subunit-domain-containing protein [Spinellus fusiger]
MDSQAPNSAHSEEHFEFVDYTSVSHFERLVNAIEETLYAWGYKEETTKVPFFHEDSLHEVLAVGQDTYAMAYYRSPVTRNTTDAPLMMDDFYLFSEEQPHFLHRATGFSELLVVSLLSDSLKTKLFSTGKSMVDLQLAKTCISACAIAMNNTGCGLPVFVQVGQTRHALYLGYMLQKSLGIQVRFNTTLVSFLDSSYSSLEGLYTLFNKKLELKREHQGYHRSDPIGDVSAMAVMTYCFKSSFDEDWKDLKEGVHFIDTDKISASSFLPTLLFGSYNDPLRGLTIETIFPILPITEYTKSRLCSEMDALTAKRWKISHEFAPCNQQRTFLSSLVQQVVNSWIKDPANRDYLAPYDHSNKGEEQEGEGQQRRLVQTLWHAMGHSSSLPQDTNKGRRDYVAQALHLIYETNKLHEHTTPVLSQYIEGYQGTESIYSTHAYGLRLKHGSTVPYRSFLWVFLVHSLSRFSDASKPQVLSDYIVFLRMLWKEIVRQFRWYWEQLIPIPNVSPYMFDSQGNEEYLDGGGKTAYSDSVKKTLGIDLRFNRLHQKLAMINCCIYRRQEEDEKRSSCSREHRGVTETSLSGVKKAEESITSDSETFFDSMDDFQDAQGMQEPETIYKEEKEQEEQGHASPRSVHSTVSSNSHVSVIASPQSVAESFPFEGFLSDEEVIGEKEYETNDESFFEGRDYQHPHLRLINTDKPMWIPLTQSAGYMTEDMIEQQADVFENLGTSQSAAHLRARLQSGQLYSDMQAFKAANPYCILEDFVRWHSPKDWMNDTEDPYSTKGRMSARMSGSGNIWQELWKCSRRVPWDRQKPLFDTVAEGEKALHYLESLSIHEVFSLLLSTLGLISYDTLALHPITKCIPSIRQGLTRLGNEIVNFPWEELRNGKYTMDGFIMSIRRQETFMCNAISLLRKFPKQYDLVNRLLVSPYTFVQDGHERATVFRLFKDEQGAITTPTIQEYVFYNDGSALAMPGRTIPERQYALIKEDEIRIIEMHTTDIIYS